jgi:hypothetical protein
MPTGAAQRLARFYGGDGASVGDTAAATELVQLVLHAADQEQALREAGEAVPPLPTASLQHAGATQRLIAALGRELATVPACAYESAAADSERASADHPAMRAHQQRAAAALRFLAALAGGALRGLQLAAHELDPLAGRRGRRQVYMTAQIEEVEEAIEEGQQVGLACGARGPAAPALCAAEWACARGQGCSVLRRHLRVG